MLILIAGPYRSGTGDDPEKIAANVQSMESYALPIFRMGHIPLLGEWLALPLVNLAGSKQIGDEAFNEIFHPIAERLLEKCDAVLPPPWFWPTCSCCRWRSGTARALTGRGTYSQAQVCRHSVASGFC
jgi:hypothetical protein